MDGAFQFDQHAAYVIGAYAITAIGLLTIGLASRQRMRRLQRQSDELERRLRRRRTQRHDA